MASGVVVKGDRELILQLRNFTHEVTDGRKPFRAFYSGWGTRRRLIWNQIKVTGGNFLGVNWPGMKPQYTRKLDGETVPAWGGVPRMQAMFVKSRMSIGKGWTSKGVKRKTFGGNVQGKKRPSGTRVKASSIMMRDTGHMANAVLGSPELVEARRMVVSTKAIDYAEEQDKVRHFMDWELPHDEVLLTRAFQAHHDAEVQKFNDKK